MKKLRLDPDELVVEPFDTHAGARTRGTVRARDFTQADCGTTPEDSCGYPATCGGTSCPSGYPVCHDCN